MWLKACHYGVSGRLSATADHRGCRISQFATTSVNRLPVQNLLYRLVQGTTVHGTSVVLFGNNAAAGGGAKGRI